MYNASQSDPKTSSRDRMSDTLVIPKQFRMTSSTLARPVIRFDIFEVDLETSELRKQGQKIKLQEQPFRVLTMLLEHPGEIVTRDALRQKLWAADTFVDFDHGLNSAVARLRETLNDSAEEPRFVETVPRQGYRFIGEAVSPQLPALSDARIAVPHRPLSIAIAAVVLCALIGVGVWWSIRNSLEAHRPSLQTVPLAGMPGFEFGPVFSPNGAEVAFLESDGEQNSGIYTTLIDGEKPLRLTNNSHDCCVTWSPDGKQIAFFRRFDEEVGIYVISALGGTERRLYTVLNPLYPSLAWSPDGKLLAFPESNPKTHRSWITLLSLADLAKRQVTFPPDAERDNDAVFSPDGSQLAFIRGALAGVVNDVFVVPTEGGGVKRLTFDKCPTSGLAWTADGREVVVSSARGGQDGLWRVSVADETIRPVAGANFPAYSPSVAPKGDLLAYQQVNRKENIWRISLADDRHAKSSAAVLISEKGRKLRPRYSPDGKRIAFESDRLGNAEIWDCDNTGGNCAQLTSLHGTAGTSAWSPDGREIAFEFHPTQHAEIYVMDVPGGVPRLIPTIPGADNLVPSWSRDGQWIYFTSKQGNLPFQLWKVPSHGGSPVQITQSGGLAAAESHDGRFLYYCKYEAGGVWRIPRGGGNEEKILDQPGETWYNWALGREGIYFIRDGDSRPASVDYFELATHKVVHIATLDKEPGWGLSLAPDGKSLLYVEPEFSESNIMVVKNFR